jgi:hypothetical protein
VVEEVDFWRILYDGMMPQRSNEFQDLVALIERALAPKGAKITESAMVDGSGPGDRREIDVLIESDVGPFHMKIAVEAKDEKRKMDITKFEAIVAKYSVGSGLKVDRVVVVSHAGFSKAVISRATREDIQILTLKDAMESDWAKKGPKQLMMAIEPHVASVSIEPKVELFSDEIMARTARIVCKTCGRDHGTPRQWAERMLRDFDRMLDLRIASSKSRAPVCMQAKWDLGHHELRLRETTVSLSAVNAHFHCSVGRGGMVAKSYDHDGQIVNHYSGIVAGKTVEMVMPDSEHPQQIALRVSDAVRIGSGTQADAPEIELTVRSIIIPPPPELVAALNRIFCDLDVKVDENPVIHDFSKGEDLNADILIRIYFASVLRTRTAIVVHREATAVGIAELRRWEAICQNASLDCVVVMSAGGFDSEAAGFKSSAVRCHSLEVPSDDELLNLVVPPLAAIQIGFDSLDIDIFSSSNAALLGDGKCVLRLGERVELGPLRLLTLVTERIRGGMLGALAGARHPVQTCREYYTDFEVALPKGLELINAEGRKRPIGLLRGRADFACVLVNFRRVEVSTVECPSALRFCSADPKYPVLHAAMVPRAVDLELSEPSQEMQVETIKQQLPEAMLRNLILPVPEDELAPRKSAVYKAVNIKMNVEECGGARALAVISLNRPRPLFGTEWCLIKAR